MLSASGVSESSNAWKSSSARLMAGRAALAPEDTALNSGPVGASTPDSAVRESRARSWAWSVLASSVVSCSPSPMPEAMWAPSPSVAWSSSATAAERSVVSIPARSGSAAANRSSSSADTAVRCRTPPGGSHGPARPSAEVSVTSSAPNRFWGRMVAAVSAGTRKVGSMRSVTRARPPTRAMPVTWPTCTPS